MREVSGKGAVYAFTTVRESATVGFTPPYVVGFVELAEQAGLLYLCNLVEVAPEAVRMGMPVEVTFEQFAEGWKLPQFRPARGGA
jgi:uncharacterized OB-fold protein